MTQGLGCEIKFNVNNRFFPALNPNNDSRSKRISAGSRSQNFSTFKKKIFLEV